MSMTDPISDLLTRLRNAQMRSHKEVECLFSKIGMNLLGVLKQEGFIEDYSEKEVAKGIKRIDVSLAYFEGKPAIKTLRRVSKPGRRVYSSISSLKKFRNGLGVKVLSTSKGVVSDAEARNKNVGGEVLFEIY